MARSVNKFIQIDVLGDKQLQRQLKGLEYKMQRKIVVKALRDSAKVVKQAVAQKAQAITNPANATERMAAVARGLKVRAYKPGRGGRRAGLFGVRVMTPTREMLGIPGDSKWYYPMHVELGARGQPARSYLRAAKHEKEREVYRLVAAEIRRGVNAAMAGGRR